MNKNHGQDEKTSQIASLKKKKASKEDSCCDTHTTHTPSHHKALRKWLSCRGLSWPALPSAEVVTLRAASLVQPCPRHPVSPQKHTSAWCSHSAEMGPLPSISPDDAQIRIEEQNRRHHFFPFPFWNQEWACVYSLLQGVITCEPGSGVCHVSLRGHMRLEWIHVSVNFALGYAQTGRVGIWNTPDVVFAYLGTPIEIFLALFNFWDDYSSNKWIAT